MDEESKNIETEDEETLDSSSFSNSTNRNIDNFDNSVKFNNLKNNQSNQSNDPAIQKLGKKNTSITSRVGSNISKSENDEQTLGSRIKGNIVSNLTGGLLGNDSEEKNGINDIAKKVKKTRRIYAILSSSAPILIQVMLLIIIIATVLTPLAMKVEDIKSFGKNTFERFGNFFSYNGFKTNHELLEESYEKVDKVIQTNSEIDRESLLGLLYYAYVTPEEYLDSLDEVNSENDLLDFGRMKRNVYTIANQLVYSTVTFHNNIIRDEIAEEDPKTKQIKKRVEYKCPGGSTKIMSSLKSFCKDGVAVYKNGPGSVDYTSADMCLDFVSEDNIIEFKKDSNFNPNMKCVTINYETNTENSKQKVINFLKYGLLPKTYFKKEFLGITNDYDSFYKPYSYKWKNMVSNFSSLTESSDDYFYNIPMYKVGSGAELDNYSSLTADKQRKVDDAVRTIEYIISSAKDMNLSDRYHIKGAVSLPLDFTIKDPLESTITSRITSKFGQRIHPVTGELKFHTGVDFSHITTSDKIYAMMDGVVENTTPISSSCGIGIKLGHDTDGDGNYDYHTQYCHLSSKSVNIGDTVMNGQTIGIMGTTGTSTGIHLHFEIHLGDGSRVDPVPYLIDVVKNQSTLSKNNNDIDTNELTSSYYTYVSGKSNTREGVALSAKFLVDNLSGLPYFCGGYTTNVIDNLWYTNQLITDKTCSNLNTSSMYGMDNLGFVSWALTQNGFANKRYTREEIFNLGDTLNMFDDRVQLGDIAYKGDKLGIIIQITDSKATVAYIDSTYGLRTVTINRNLATSLFPNVVSMDNVYNR